MDVLTLFGKLRQFRSDIEVFIPHHDGIDCLESSTDCEIVFMDKTENDGTFVMNEDDKIEGHEYEAVLRIF